MIFWYYSLQTSVVWFRESSKSLDRIVEWAISRNIMPLISILNRSVLILIKNDVKECNKFRVTFICLQLSIPCKCATCEMLTVWKDILCVISKNFKQIHLVYFKCYLSILIISNEDIHFLCQHFTGWISISTLN